MMTIGRSISNSTKTLISKTLESIKSCFSSMRYQKLPKRLPCRPFSSCVDSSSQADYREVLDKFYDELIISRHEDSYQKSAETKNVTRKKSESKNKNVKLLIPSSSSSSSSTLSPGEQGTSNEGRSLEKNEHRCEDIEDVKGCCIKDFLVEKKLRELRKMEMSNVDHVLDIEEVLHYYSRLTCPAYLGIVDKFFMEIYSEFFGEATSVRGN